MHPRRSVLFVPGSNDRAMEKARGLDADALIFDLEDSIASEAKSQARAAIAAAIARGGYGRRELILRINALDTEWAEEDLRAAARMKLDAVLLPKVESEAEPRKAEAILISAGAPLDLGIWCMIETARAVLHAEAITSATLRLQAFVMGTADLSKELHAEETPLREPIVTALGLCVLAARAYGLAVLDGVHFDIADTSGFERSCRQGRMLGFDGKTLIHPSTIAVANRIFAPDDAAVARARRIIAAFEDAKAQGKGVAVLDGHLIERLHVADAKRILALAAAVGMPQTDH
ncbi:MAG: CoA ester lyase [Alphaproteobacteria bacterium]|nr:CoA ester lyase [Alphaproteobacteria bacterium]